jgi:hypothetical protein
MQPVEKIRKLVWNLPKSDQPLAEQFIQNRDFDSLQELVDSAIQRVKKGLKKEHPKEEYLEVDEWELRKLKTEVDNYVALIDNDLEENYV